MMRQTKKKGPCGRSAFLETVTVNIAARQADAHSATANNVSKSCRGLGINKVNLRDEVFQAHHHSDGSLQKKT